MMASYGAFKVLLIAVLIIGSAAGKKGKNCKKKKNCSSPPPDEPCVPETLENPCKYSGQVILAVDHPVGDKDDKCFIEFCWCEEGVIKPVRVYKDCCCRPTVKPDGAEEILDRLLNQMGQIGCSLGMFGQPDGGMPDLLGGEGQGIGNLEYILGMLGNGGNGGNGMGMIPENFGTGEGSFTNIGAAFECVKNIEDMAAEDPNFDVNAALLECFKSSGVQGIQGIFGGQEGGGDCLAIFLECLGVEVFDLDSFDSLGEDLPDNFMQCLLVVLSTDGCGNSMGGGGDPDMGGFASMFEMFGGGGNGFNPGGMGGSAGIGSIESIIECLKNIAANDPDEKQALLGCFENFSNNGIGALLASLTNQDDYESCQQSLFNCMGIEGPESIFDATGGLHPMFRQCLIDSLENGNCGFPEIDVVAAANLFGGGELPEVPDCIDCLVDLLQSGISDTDPGLTAAVQACFDQSMQEEEDEESACDTIFDCLGIEGEEATVTMATLTQCLQSYAQSMSMAMFGVGEG